MSLWGCQVHISNFSMQPLLCRPAKGHGIVDELLTKVLSVLIPMSSCLLGDELICFESNQSFLFSAKI